MHPLFGPQTAFRFGLRPEVMPSKPLKRFYSLRFGRLVIGLVTYK